MTSNGIQEIHVWVSEKTTERRERPRPGVYNRKVRIFHLGPNLAKILIFGVLRVRDQGPS